MAHCRSPSRTCWPSCMSHPQRGSSSWQPASMPSESSGRPSTVEQRSTSKASLLPAHLLAVILKDFLRKIPSKLLHSELYEEWMAALQMSSRQEKVAALKELNVVSSSLPAVQGGQQVAHGQPPAPQALAVPAAKHQQKCGYQQDDRQQPSHLHWAKPA